MSWQAAAFWAVAAGAGLLLVFFGVTGRWKAAGRVLQGLAIRKRGIEIDRLDLERKAAIAKVGANDAYVIELDARYKQLEKDNAKARLELEGKSHDEVVAALRDRGF